MAIQGHPHTALIAQNRRRLRQDLWGKSCSIKSPRVDEAMAPPTPKVRDVVSLLGKWWKHLGFGGNLNKAT